MIRKKKRLTSLSEVNTTNLVDVTLVLLIIFILVAPYIKEGLEVDLPKTETQQSISDEDSLLITIGKNKEILLNERPYSIAAVGEYLSAAQAKNPNVKVLLKADSKVEYEQVVKVMDVVRSAGVVKLGLVTQPAAKE